MSRQTPQHALEIFSAALVTLALPMLYALVLSFWMIVVWDEALRWKFRVAGTVLLAVVLCLFAIKWAVNLSMRWFLPAVCVSVTISAFCGGLWFFRGGRWLPLSDAEAKAFFELAVIAAVGTLTLLYFSHLKRIRNRRTDREPID